MKSLQNTALLELLFDRTAEQDDSKPRIDIDSLNDSDARCLYLNALQLRDELTGIARSLSDVLQLAANHDTDVPSPAVVSSASFSISNALNMVRCLDEELLPILQRAVQSRGRAVA